MKYTKMTALLLKKYRATAALVLAVVVLGLGGVAGNKASAASTCNSTTAVGTTGAAVQVCIKTGQNSNHVTVAYPSLEFLTPVGETGQMRPREGWIFMYQCNLSGSSCTAISTANELGPSFNRLPGAFSGSWDYQLTAASKAWSSGVRYKACGALTAWNGYAVPGEPTHTICTLPL